MNLKKRLLAFSIGFISATALAQPQALLWPRLIKKWVQQQKLDNEYQTLLTKTKQFSPSGAPLSESLINELYEQIFIKHYPLFAVSKDEVKQFYEQDGPYKELLDDQLLYAIDAFGIKFEDHQTFIDTLKNIKSTTSLATLKNIAQQQNLPTQALQDITFSMPPEIPGMANIAYIGSLLFPPFAPLKKGDTTSGCTAEDGQTVCWVLKVTDKKKIRNKRPSFHQFYNNPQFTETQQFIVDLLQKKKAVAKRQEAFDQLQKRFKMKAPVGRAKQEQLHNIKTVLANHYRLPYQVLKKTDQPYKETINADLVSLMGDYYHKLDELIDNIALPKQHHEAVNELIALQEAFLKQKNRIKQWQSIMNKRDFQNPLLNTIRKEAAAERRLPLKNIGRTTPRGIKGADFDHLLLRYLDKVNELIAQFKTNKNRSMLVTRIKALRDAYQEQKELLEYYWHIKKKPFAMVQYFSTSSKNTTNEECI